MLQLLPAPTERRNPQLVRSLRISGSAKSGDAEGNVDWLERQLSQQDMGAGSAPPANSSELPANPELAPAGTSPPVIEPTYVVLLGGTDQIAYRLRIAQSHLRHDMWPSHWSHAVLLGPRKSTVARQRLYEISLQPSRGFDLAVQRNGLQETTLSRYDDAAEYPNIAVLRLNVEREAWAAETGRGEPPNVLQAFQTQRAILDGPEAILSWLAFAWGVGRTANPLFDGIGVPSALMIEAVLNGVGFDVSPGVDGRLSAPEVFWQSAKWWYPYYLTNNQVPIIGRYCISSRINDSLLRQANREHRAPGRISGR